MAKKAFADRASRRDERMLPELDALNRLRLRKEWTWEQLGQEMRRARAAVPYRTLHYLLTTPYAKPHDKNLGRIQRFLLAVGCRPTRPKRTGAPEASEVTV